MLEQISHAGGDQSPLVAASETFSDLWITLFCPDRLVLV